MLAEEAHIHAELQDLTVRDGDEAEARRFSLHEQLKIIELDLENIRIYPFRTPKEAQGLPCLSTDFLFEIVWRVKLEEGERTIRATLQSLVPQE